MTKLATNGPIAAPVVLSSVAIPVLFIRSPTLAWTSAAIDGNRMPESNATGNINATHKTAICHQRRSNTPVGAGINSPGKNKYERSTKIAAASNRTGSIWFGRADERKIAPASKTAKSNSCQHNREHNRENSRRRRDVQPQKSEPNHFQREKNQTRAEADEKQTPRRPITRIEAQRKFGVLGRVGAFETCEYRAAPNLATTKAIAAAMQTAAAAAKLVP